MSLPRLECPYPQDPEFPLYIRNDVDREHDFMPTKERRPIEITDEEIRRIETPSQSGISIDYKNTPSCYKTWWVFKCSKCYEELLILEGHVIHISRESWRRFNQRPGCQS